MGRQRSTSTQSRHYLFVLIEDADFETLDLAEQGWFLDASEEKKTLFRIARVISVRFAHEAKEKNPSFRMGRDIPCHHPTRLWELNVRTECWQSRDQYIPEEPVSILDTA